MLYCHFNKIIKGPETNFQSPALNKKYVKNVCHTAHQYLTNFILIVLGFKRNKHKCNFHYVAMPMMMPQKLKSVDFTKTQKSRYLENEVLFFLKVKN